MTKQDVNKVNSDKLNNGGKMTDLNEPSAIPLLDDFNNYKS